MSSFDPFAEFAVFNKPASTPAPAAPAPAPAPAQERKPIMNSQPIMQQQQQQQQQPMQQNPGGNPFAAYGAAPPPTMPPAPQPPQPIVPAAQQPSPWSMQTQQPPAPAAVSPGGYNGKGFAPSPGAPAPVATSPVFGQPAPTPVATSPVFGQPAPAPFQQAMPQQQQQQQQMVPVPSSAQSQASGYLSSPTANVGVPPQQPYQQQMSPHQTQPPQQQPQQQPRTAPSAVVAEDDDFFGDFSNSVTEKSPSRPPSVFEAGPNDDVSYLSKSTGGGTERGASSRMSPLDDPKFAPKPAAVHGLANAQALSQHAPPGASPLPDFDLVTHSGYILSRISFRTILIKKWKQTFWVTYKGSQILFFRSSADFEDWISNPYLSQGQRDFLIKLKVDFVEDLYKNSIRGYQVTKQRLKNYNNKMLQQFKLERWMDYGPTIAAAFASPNEREVFNLRTILLELMKKMPKDPPRGRNLEAYANAAQYGGHGQYGEQREPYQYPSSASVGGGYRTGGGGSVRSQHSASTYGVMSAGPVERSREPVGQYGNYGVHTGANGHY